MPFFYFLTSSFICSVSVSLSHFFNKQYSAGATIMSESLLHQSTECHEIVGESKKTVVVCLYQEISFSRESFRTRIHTLQIRGSQNSPIIFDEGTSERVNEKGAWRDLYYVVQQPASEFMQIISSVALNEMNQETSQRGFESADSVLCFGMLTVKSSLRILISNSSFKALLFPKQQILEQIHHL